MFPAVTVVTGSDIRLLKVCVMNTILLSAKHCRRSTDCQCGDFNSIISGKEGVR